MTTTAAELRIKGMVQGVGYRYFCYREATGLGLTGWVRNVPDGSVRARVEGERNDIETLIRRLKAGPSSAHVDQVDVDWQETKQTSDSFTIDH